MLERGCSAGHSRHCGRPKGDLTNLLLHFPDLLPEDFQALGG